MYHTANRYCPLWVFPFGLTLKVFKTRLLGRGFHALIKSVSFSSPTDVGCHNPSPFRAQRLRWHSFLSPIDVGPLPNPPFPRPYKGCFILLPNRCRMSQSTPLQGQASSLAFIPFSNQCGTPTKSTIFGANILAGTPPRVYNLLVGTSLGVWL